MADDDRDETPQDEPTPEATPDEWWAPMERVFDTEWPQHRPPSSS